MKVKKVTAVDLVAEQMKMMIQSGKWKIYERIPPEAELAEMFGVNRTTIRMALQKLNVIGVLETQDGNGTFVCSFNFEHLIEAASDYMQMPEMYEDVIAFNVLLEKEALRLAVQRATEAEIAEFRALCVQFKKAHDSVLLIPPKERINHPDQLATHRAMMDINAFLCQISHNSLLYYAFQCARGPIQMCFVERAQKRIMGGKTPVVFDMLERLCQGLEAHDYAYAEAALLDLLAENV